MILKRVFTIITLIIYLSTHGCKPIAIENFYTGSKVVVPTPIPTPAWAPENAKDYNPFTE